MASVKSGPEKMIVSNSEKRKDIKEFYSSVNKKMKEGEIEPKLAMKVADLSLLLTCGVPKEDINPGVYRKLRGYLISNMGECRVDFGQMGSVERVKVGSIDMVNLYSEDIDYDSIDPRPFRLPHGMIPTSDDPDCLDVSFDGKSYVGMQVNLTKKNEEIQRNNVKVGKYYFSRKNILSKNHSAELVKFEIGQMPENELIQTIESYDKQGNMEPKIQIDDFIEMNNTYHLLSQRDLIDVEEITKSK